MEKKRLPGCFKALLVILIIIAVIISVFFIFRKTILDSTTAYLIKRDALKKCGCIVVLAGERGERVVEGVRLYKEGWAPLMVMSGGLGEAGIPLSHLMKLQAIGLGIPAGKILEENRSQDTGEDAVYTLEILKNNGIKSFILVTSPYHSRRTHIIFEKVMKKSGIDFISYPVRDSWFDQGTCWNKKRGIKAIYSEYSKLIWYLFFPHSMETEDKILGE